MTNPRIERYRRAVDLESSQTSFWGQWAYNLPPALLQIPNGYRYGKRISQLAWILDPLMPVFRLGWATVGMPLLTAVWAARWLLSGGWGRRASIPATVYLHSSGDRYLAYVPASSGRPSVAVTLPFRHSPPGPWAEKAVGLQSITTRYAIVRAAMLSIAATMRILFSPQRKKILFTYTAPNWFWVNEALESAAPRSVWMSNHYDRWAALFTTLPSIRVTIVQHGQLGQVDTRTGQRVMLRLAAPLSNVEKVFVVDRQSVDEFKEAITGSGPAFEVISPSLKVVPWSRAHPNQLRLLVLGSPIVQAVLDRLIAGIRSAFPGNVAIAYRPHPRETSPIKLPPGKEVVAAPTDETIPEADIVLDYGSSFAKEVVAATGTAVISWWPAGDDAVQSVVRAIMAFSGKKDRVPG